MKIGGTPARNTLQNSFRISLRDKLTRRDLIRRQIEQGRPDPYYTWCGVLGCSIDGRVFRRPNFFLSDENHSTEKVSVREYFERFAESMLDTLYPGRYDVGFRDAKFRDVLSFVDSPPVRVAFWQFSIGCRSKKLKVSDEQFMCELARARKEMGDLTLGSLSGAGVSTVHRYLDTRDEEPRHWGLQSFIMRFLISVEVWRQHRSCRHGIWDGMLSCGRVAEFLTAMLYSLWQMHERGCFVKEPVNGPRCWDRVWQQWLDQYPTGNYNEGEAFILRAGFRESGEEVLERVGYLGGIGIGEVIYCRPGRASLRRSKLTSLRVNDATSEACPGRR